MLADLGLPDAVAAAARSSQLVVEVRADAVDRYAPEVERAVYFCIREALQNAAKHAAGASRVIVRLDGRTPGRLHVWVADDGAGFTPALVQRGAGLRNMTDRLVALGGALEIMARPGGGTQVVGWVPTGSGR